MPDGIEIGEKITDTAQLYLDAIYVLSFKELYQRLEERNSKNGETFEWDTDYFNLVEENDVNFLLEDDENEGIEDIVDDFMFSTSPNSNFNNPSPTANESMSSATATGPTISKVNSTSRLSINGNKNNSIVGRSRSTSSLSMNSIASINTVNGVSATNKLPLFLREQDIDYQNYRQALFSELLRQYPASRQEIIHHAKVDIPPILRGKIWAAILGVSGDLQYEYDQINKYVDMGADRQIEVDVPRCHQYNQLLASSVGHEKLRRLLKAWVCANKNLVYWQVLQEYLAIFRHLLSFHDPELSTHLDAIGFMPDLYAIPWFLTLFTHVFPLDKIYHLWDKFLVGPSSLPLFAGIAILRQIRDTLLSYEFNDCIVLFSDSFPRVDIEKCVQSALSMCKVTPLSIVARMHGPSSLESIGKSTHDDGEEKNSKIPSTQLWWEKPISIEMKKVELAPRLFVTDLLKILAYSLILDIRPETDYANIIKKVNRKYHIVVASRSQEGPEVCHLIAKMSTKFNVVDQLNVFLTY
ncbi:rab-GTPase-TBC domain-containing protein [Mycotypha africana]|uniref:rab-GTPase-TBC domain-containing protein n=1 Tax=Mycotypha africana TaxID=64632 RepID=UPI002301C937|nr:rab-GTPase-TBC domain-containing protein [Mycotypha africana]KAI8988297.1 rab-GTPase-TBC domain-containing protein [Mycotypha africana]